MKAPIDNKNVLEDFTEIFHNGEYIENVENHITYQIFFKCGCLCEISYRFGQNWFKIRYLEGLPDNLCKCIKEIESIVSGMNVDAESHCTNITYNPITGVYEFNFVES